MAKFIKGDIVVIPFPFSDLSGNKRRPALVLADLPGSDIILCQITSRHRKDKFSIELSQNDFSNGGLPVLSYIRPNRIFTADKNIIIRKAGTLKPALTKNIIQQLISILEN
jgi:mRNA interferase MazF